MTTGVNIAHNTIEQSVNLYHGRINAVNQVNQYIHYLVLICKQRRPIMNKTLTSVKNVNRSG